MAIFSGEVTIKVKFKNINDKRDDIGSTILENKLASTFQNKPLLTRDELIKSLGISGSLLDKWMKPLSEADIIKDKPDFSKIEIKKGNRTWFTLAEVKHILRS